MTAPRVSPLVAADGVTPLASAAPPQPAHQAASRSHPDLARWMPAAFSGQGALSGDRDLVTARVHDIARNDGWASAALDRQVDSVVGSGWMLSAQPNARTLGIDQEVADELADTIEAAWDDYAEDPGFWSDAVRRGPVAANLGLAFRHRVMDGEALGVLRWLPRGGPYATAMLVVDPERLSQPMGRLETDRLRQGVELDVDGAAVAYHIRARHPGDDLVARSRGSWERVPRETDWGRPVVVHAFEERRRGQLRGIAPLAPILRKLKQVTRYDEAELQAATVNAVLAAFITSPMDPEAAMEAVGYQDGRMAFHEKKSLSIPSVQVGHLYPGEDVKLTTPGHPNGAFEGFVRAALRNVASAAGLSYEQLTMDWSQVNYSSARAALLEVWRGLTARKDSFASGFMRPWYGAWLEEAIETGRIKLPKGAPPFRTARAAYVRSEWIGPGRGWVDPQKEADAAVTRMDAGLSTLQRECAEQGLRWKAVIRQRARERRELEQAGLDPVQPLRPALSRGAPPEPAARGAA
jgi:lambda family phage portal protein